MNQASKSIIAFGLTAVLLTVAFPSATQAQYTKRAAGIGALLGLALGNDVWDVAAGAALGAAGGSIAGMATEGKRKKRQNQQAQAEAARQAEISQLQVERERALAEREQQWAEMELSKKELEMLQRERELADREQLLAEVRVQATDAAAALSDVEMAIIQAIGPDAWEGYKALRGCQHDRAFALAGVAETSNDPNHRLGSLWLQAMTAIDQKNSQKADTVFQSIAQHDPDIDTVQQASLAADQAVLEMRAERREIGIAPCR